MEEYCVEPNATAAVKKAGYSVKTAYGSGSESLRRPEIRAAIEERINQYAMEAAAVTARLSAQARGELPTERLDAHAHARHPLGQAAAAHRALEARETIGKLLLVG